MGSIPINSTTWSCGEVPLMSTSAGADSSRPPFPVRSGRCILDRVSAHEAESDEIVDLPMGFNLFTAQVIAGSVKTAGFNVQLREMTTEGVALSPPLSQHRLMVFAADIDAVRQLLDKSFPTGG